MVIWSHFSDAPKWQPKLKLENQYPSNEAQLPILRQVNVLPMSLL